MSDITKTQKTLDLLCKDWHTALTCALAGGCLSLSQRVGEFKREGILIETKWVTTDGGAKVMAYRCNQAEVAS